MLKFALVAFLMQVCILFLFISMCGDKLHKPTPALPFPVYMEKEPRSELAVEGSPILSPCLKAEQAHLQHSSRRFCLTAS